MTDLKMTLHQSPDHVVHRAETVIVVTLAGVCRVVVKGLR